MKRTAGMLAVLLAGAMLFSLTATAGLKEGRITSILIDQNSAPDKAFIKVDTAYSQPEPVCSVGVSGWDFVMDISTPTGKSAYALAVAAQMAGVTVMIGGTNACELRLGYETLAYIHTQP